MDFNSYIFILVFLPIVIVAYYICNAINRKIGTWLLSVASCVFIAYADMRFLYFVMISIICNLFIAQMIRILRDMSKLGRVMLAIGIGLNIAVLGIGKYTNFIITTINQLTMSDISVTTFLIPLGISFLTFQQIAFLVDVYKGEVNKIKVTDYVFYVTFFPKYVQGPITGYRELTAQLYKKARRYPNAKHFACGLWFFVAGLAKKVLIADVLAIAVTWGYDRPVQQLTSLEAIIVMLCYTLQIYFDFGGYSQMALGIAKMLNITLPNNFDTPYKATTISEFWKRWHISLTSFLRKYLYIPLGGNRKGKIRTYINTMIIFCVSGIWHGASWNYLVWGALHGVAMCFDKLMQQLIPPIEKGKKVLQAIGWGITFILVNVLWVFFRAPSFGHATALIQKAFSFDAMTVQEELSSCFAIAEYEYIGDKVPWIGMILEEYRCLPMIVFIGISGMIALCNKEKTEEFRPTWGKSVAAMVLFLWAVISLSHVSEYIYGSF